MLIATLPTLVSDRNLLVAEQILNHPLIYAARYNTGGASPYTPAEILGKLNPLAQKSGKKLYVDLEGRQVRIDRWTPLSAGSVVLNRDFEIELPGKVYFRGLGWFEILNADAEERRIFFDPSSASLRYYLGESQSVHIIADKFEVFGYLANQDADFINIAVGLGIRSFMLSFVENLEDINEFIESFRECEQSKIKRPEIVLKIESMKGLDFVKQFSPALLGDMNLMAARDDFFLAHIDNRKNFLESLRTIITKDPNAILASKVMSGLESGTEISMGDMADMILMAQFGYRNFMFSDELTKKFDMAMENWRSIIMPLLESGNIDAS